jgi:hypothetical protein
MNIFADYIQALKTIKLYIWHWNMQVKETYFI